MSRESIKSELSLKDGDMSGDLLLKQCEKWRQQCAKFHAENKALKAKLAKLRWIPVSEGLPKENVLVLMWGEKRNGGIPIAMIWDAHHKNYHNTHWREIDLPESEE